MRRFLVCLTLSVFVGPAIAQELREGPGREDAPDNELSELERLSRTGDDPFAGVIASQQREPVTVTLRALNKTTARFKDIEIEMNQIAQFGSLEIQPRMCDTRPPEEFPETTAFVEIFDTEYGNRESDLKVALPPPVERELPESESETEEFEVLEIAPAPFGETEDVVDLTPIDTDYEPSFGEQPTPEVLEGPQAEGTNIFRGWMFASSPALNPLEHPVYDVWVISCKTRVVDN